MHCTRTTRTTTTTNWGRHPLVIPPRSPTVPVQETHLRPPRPYPIHLLLLLMLHRYWLLLAPHPPSRLSAPFLLSSPFPLLSPHSIQLAFALTRRPRRRGLSRQHVFSYSFGHPSDTLFIPLHARRRISPPELTTHPDSASHSPPFTRTVQPVIPPTDACSLFRRPR